MNRRQFTRGALALSAGALAPLPAGAKIAKPPFDFGSNRNYHMYGGGVPITKLRVTVRIDEDLVAPTGMSMQLNANASATADCDFQQFVTGFNPKWDTLRIGWSIENFPSPAYRWQLHESDGLPCRNGAGQTEQTCTGDLFNDVHPNAPFATFPGPSSRLPAGFAIVYDLIDGANGVIEGASFSVIDDRGRTTNSGPQLISALKLAGTNLPVPAAALSPILSFQLNIVGLSDGVHTTVSSGSGTITYEAETPLRPRGNTIGLGLNQTMTVESSNIVYSELAAASRRKIVQKFSVPVRPALQCPSGESYNTETKHCQNGDGRDTNDKAPLQKPPA